MEPKIKETAWNPEIEKQILKQWEESRIHDFHREGDIFVIDTPPPYPSGRPWHIGAAAHYAQIDMIARTARMRGKKVLFPIGIDRNGLPVEMYTEKKYNIKMHETDRGEFLKLCATALDDLEVEMIQIMKSLGLSGNFSDYYRTDSERYRALTQSTFIELWKKGLIYIANRPNNYDWVTGTTIADAEIIYEEIPTKLVYMKFKVKDSDRILTIASTRPELLCSCQAIVVNPEDERYTDVLGKKVLRPLINREVEIKTHPSAEKGFGSGAVMVCSYGDQNDVSLFRELRLQEIVAIGKNGRMSEVAGPYAGLKIKQARERIIEDLQNHGFVEKIENINHRTPISERSKTPIEIIPMEEYYLKQKDYIERIRDLGSKIIFYPPMHKQILMNWLESISIDWPISRRRYYGTEIPIWYCKNCNEPQVPEPGKYYKPWKNQSPITKCVKCSATEFVGEERTFDTWMDSSVSPLYVSKYKQDEEFFRKTYPGTIRPQSKDIVRTWLYYTILRCEQLTGKLPWDEAWIMGYGVDEHGTKMSKSKGNVIDPLPVIQKYGADTFRFWSASEVNLGYDFRCSEQRIAGSQKFLSKLWNLGRFLSSFELVANQPVLEASDKWMLAELARLVDECKKGYEDYNFFVPANAIRDFTWNIFAAHYVEMVKGRAYATSEDICTRSALYKLHRCLSTILLLIAPVTPFIAEELWTKIYSSSSIHIQPMFREEMANPEMLKYTKQIINFNSMVWNKKKETIKDGKPLSLKDPISVTVPSELAQFGRDLKEMHNLA